MDGCWIACFFDHNNVEKNWRRRFVNIVLGKIRTKMKKEILSMCVLEFSNFIVVDRRGDIYAVDNEKRLVLF